MPCSNLVPRFQKEAAKKKPAAPTKSPAPKVSGAAALASSQRLGCKASVVRLSVCVVLILYLFVASLCLRCVSPVPLRSPRSCALAVVPATAHLSSMRLLSCPCHRLHACMSAPCVGIQNITLACWRTATPDIYNGVIYGTSKTSHDLNKFNATLPTAAFLLESNLSSKSY